MSTEPTTVLSPTLDEATIDATRWLITELRSDGHSIQQTSEIAAEHLADIVAMYGPHDAVVDPDFDPTDAELEQAWNGPDAHEAHRAAWTLHQQLHDRSAS